MRLFEIFENGQRLEQFYITVDQGRYHHLPIDRAVFGSELVDLLKMQETVFAADGLQVQRDARAETRLRAEIRMKLRRHLSSGFWRRHYWRGSMPDERLLARASVALHGTVQFDRDAGSYDERRL
jgi:hypothetical protein